MGNFLHGGFPEPVAGEDFASHMNYGIPYLIFLYYHMPECLGLF
jgi:hypothetical protein